MHVVTASDRNYIPGVFTLIASVRRYNNSAKFTVLAVDWNDRDLYAVKCLERELKCSISVKGISSTKFRGLSVTRKHLTAATYSRLLIPELLSGDEKVIYMDSDMVATGSLAEAWNVELGENLIGAVRCPSPMPKVLSALNLNEGDYVNAGFIVMNLEKWRAESIAERCLSALSDNPDRFMTQDESAINDICRSRITYLPDCFNVYAAGLISENQNCDPEDVRVMHFILKKKPWLRASVFSPIWHFESRDVAHLLEIDRSVTKPRLRERLSEANRRRKIFLAKFSIGSSTQKYIRHKRFVEWMANYETKRFQ